MWLFLKQQLIAFAGLIALLAAPASAGDIYLQDGSLWNGPGTTSSAGRPVLFVHGHDLFGLSATGGQYYRRTWTDDLDSPLRRVIDFFAPNSTAATDNFADAIEDNPQLSLTPYYLNFVDHQRPIEDDAIAIGDAVQQLLEHHNPDWDFSLFPDQAPPIRVAVIAFSKGTISTRLYLQNLSLPHHLRRLTIDPLSPSRAVSEFVAIAPPNHGLIIDPGRVSSGANGWFRLLYQGTSLSDFLRDWLNQIPAQQLSNGIRGDAADRASAFCGSLPAGAGFIDDLNGHPSADTRSYPSQHGSLYASEAPGSRSNHQQRWRGTLYVTLYDDDGSNGVGRDYIGRDGSGGSSSNPGLPDCNNSAIGPQGRRLAANLSPDAENIAVSGIADKVNGATMPVLNGLLVHGAMPRYRDVICQALFTVEHGYVDRTQDCGAGPRLEVPKNWFLSVPEPPALPSDPWGDFPLLFGQ